MEEFESTRTSAKHRLLEDDILDEPNKRRRKEYEVSAQKVQEGVSDVRRFSWESEDTYKVSKQIITPMSQPHPTQNLLALYSLASLASSVARKHPITGEKINVLRKSYKGKIRDFPGKNDVIVKEGGFFHLLSYPDEEWDVQNVRGREFSLAVTSSNQGLLEDIERKLNIALSMSPIPLPTVEQERWRTIVDLENNVTKQKTTDNVQPSRSQATITDTPYSHSEEFSRRPKRRGTSRNYHDEDFEGYAEGFDDDPEDEQNMDGDDERRSIVSGAHKKRCRKDFSASSNFGSAVSRFSTGPVSVGGHVR